MKRGILLLLAGVLFVLLSACTRTIYEPAVQRHSEVHHWRDTIVQVERKGEYLMNTTLDTVSLLCGEQATSRAVIANGKLKHTLVVYPRSDSVAVPVQDVYVTDSVAYPLPVSHGAVENTPWWHRWEAAVALVTAFALGAWLSRLGVKLRE